MKLYNHIFNKILDRMAYNRVKRKTKLLNSQYHNIYEPEVTYYIYTANKKRWEFCIRNKQNTCCANYRYDIFEDTLICRFDMSISGKGHILPKNYIYTSGKNNLNGYY